MANCELCGEPMPLGEEMFLIHGYSGPCPREARLPTEAELILQKEEEKLSWIQRHLMRCLRVRQANPDAISEETMDNAQHEFNEQEYVVKIARTKVPKGT